tara:strand:- start:42 stop:659 length:618 start_codon:yes stop_codon:yes gene_type:complete
MQPLISCLCLTKSSPVILKKAIDCFNLQTYENKELILVCDESNPYIKEIKKFTNKNIKLFFAPDNTALGGIRNISVNNARGEYIAQWDDDNIHHQDRLKIQYNSLKQNNKKACYLSRVLIHDYISKTKGVSKKGRGIESTIVALKKALPKYEENKKIAEDLPAKLFFLKNNEAVMIDKPQLYIYNIHKNNTCKYRHLISMMDVII